MRGRDMQVVDFAITTARRWRALISVSACLALSLACLSPEVHAADEKRRRTVETEVVVLTTSGFVPSRIQRPQGDFRLQVTSALPLSDLTLEVQDVSQKAVKTKAFTNLKGQRQRWLDDYSLTPGTYVLQVREVPKFKLEIVIGK